MLNARGEILSLHSQRVPSGLPRELCRASAPLNQLALYEDVPVQWDAWDIDNDQTSSSKP